MAPVEVISQQPPGGRCTLYARYADVICRATGWSHALVHSEVRDAHGAGFPSLRLGGVALQPEDCFLLTADDICSELARLGLAPDILDMLRGTLSAIYDEFVAAAAR